MDATNQYAPGWPGIPARWTSSAKNGVGTALNLVSRVWFTISHGILDEIYYPRVDQACTRDMGFLVTDGSEFFSEEKRHTHSVINQAIEGVPAFHLTNTCVQGRYRIDKDILTDPWRETVLQRITFTPLIGQLKDYHLAALLAPHLGNQGSNNTTWVGEYKGVPMLFAQQSDLCLALASNAPWLSRSVGFAGVSDGWQDLSQHKQMTWEFERAENGNVALTGEIDLESCEGQFILAVGFGTNPAEAGQRARASLVSNFDEMWQKYTEEWQSWLAKLQDLDIPEIPKNSRNLYTISATVLRTHESKRFPGGLIASLSIPWGFAKGDDDLGGYHLSWPRDLAESAGGLLAAGAREDVRRVLFFLQVTQESDGHWPQNMWLDGRPYWEGIQMDETAFPILLVDLARREKALLPGDLDRLWPMIQRAAQFLVSNGPVTGQDRWEEDAGFSPFTLAVEISAILAAADLADQQGESDQAGFLRETADAWNASIERWIYVTGTDLATSNGIDGYYVRVAPPDVADAASPAKGFVPIKNRPPDQSNEPAAYIISPDALALVRFGLRAADDPRILNTIKVIDSILKTETPNGPTWHRYNDDGYGEHEDGSPFDGTGIGRGWPLLTGERAHYELAAGRREEAIKLLKTLESFAGDGGLLPEQVWDSSDIPQAELYFGRPSGSAMPLVWAHAEYIKLRRSLKEGRVFDTPPQAFQRYVLKKTRSLFSIWRPNLRCQAISTGKTLRIESFNSGTLVWSQDDWHTSQQQPLRDSRLGVYLLDLGVDEKMAGKVLRFHFTNEEDPSWQSEDYELKITRED